MKPIKTIMVIDDDDIFVYLTRKTIEKTNLVEQIKVSENGKDAINYLTENAENPELLPEIILLDLSMPIMDGWQFLDEYAAIESKIEKNIIIYIVTSSISPEDINKAKSNDCVTDLIIKPLTKDKLIEIINKLSI
jgi:CheY-like chemotaxis protein